MPMENLLERAVETARGLPREVQDDFAILMLQLLGEEQPTIIMTPEEEASFDESLEQEARGAFATDQQVLAIWEKHGL